MTTYRVTIKVEGREPTTCVVEAADEWKARTRAMIDTLNPNAPRQLRGERVEFDVVEVAG